jgi:ferric-dicitrate binding protein FerR (iron transport regulator)
MAYADEDTIRTTLLEGSVKVSSMVNGQWSILKPGEQAALARTSGSLQIEKPNPGEVTDWRNGQFDFNETNMEDILRQVARWYDIKLEYRGSVANIGFTGRISRKENIQDVLDILSDTRKVHFELNDNKTVVVIPGPR